MTRHLSAAAIELFAAYDVSIESCEPMSTSLPAQDLYCMASIGYVGDGVRGVLVLAASEKAAKDWMIAAGIGDCEIADTIGEFSNMLLGHLKARLLREGIPISLATPMTVSGTALHFSLPPGLSCWQFFEGPGWRSGVRLDATFEPGFQAHAFDDAQEPATGGDAILF